MPRPRKPTELHKQDGTYQKCRHENRGDSVPVDGWPEKPAGLSPQQDALWESVVNHLPHGCVGSIDTTALRDMVRVFGMWWDALAAAEQDPLDRQARIAVTQLHAVVWKYVQEYGLTPIARSRLQVPKGDESGTPMEVLTRLIESRN